MCGGATLGSIELPLRRPFVPPVTRRLCRPRSISGGEAAGRGCGPGGIRRSCRFSLAAKLSCCRLAPAVRRGTSSSSTSPPLPAGEALALSSPKLDRRLSCRVSPFSGRLAAGPSPSVANVLYYTPKRPGAQVDLLEAAIGGLAPVWFYRSPAKGCSPVGATRGNWRSPWSAAEQSLELPVGAHGCAPTANLQSPISKTTSAVAPAPGPSFAPAPGKSGRRLPPAQSRPRGPNRPRRLARRPPAKPARTGTGARTRPR